MNRALAAAALALSAAGCSARELALHAVADALGAQGGVFAGDEDPELVREAIPFGLKTYESVLENLPGHRGLLLATASGFTQYAYAFVAQDADFIDATDFPRALELRQRASKLFLRGRNYALRGLELNHPGFREKLARDRAAALADVAKDELDLLYWAGAAWAAALMASKEDLNLIAELPIAGSFIQRVVELDPSYNRGAAHEFLISFEGSRSEAMGGSPARARAHYAKALEFSEGRRASVHLALAESVCVREQKRAEFKALVEKALDVDPDAVPAQRLQNLLALKRARWLLTRMPDLFLEPDEKEDSK